jgi:hypothetical protein
MINESQILIVPYSYEEMTKKYLDYAFIYNPENGELRNKVKRHGKANIGDIAGCIHSDGYIKVHIQGIKYPVHRLIWIMMTGEHVPDEIDHINRIRNDNRWCNLRLATRFQNSGNTTISKNNTSGYKGVHWNSHRSRWRATIEINGKSIHIGSFVTKEDAFEAYKLAAVYHFGEYAHF